MKTASSREAERAMDDRREHDSVNVSNIYTNAGGSKPLAIRLLLMAGSQRWTTLFPY